MRIKRVSTSKIVQLLLDPRTLLYGYFGPKDALQAGQMLHLRFGMGGGDTYRRFIEHEEELYEILGTPDKIYPDEMLIEEFKTYRRRSKQMGEQRAKIQLQIYGWLTGLKKGRITMFSRETEKPTSVDMLLSPTRAEKLIEEGLRRYKIISSMRKITLEEDGPDE